LAPKAKVIVNLTRGSVVCEHGLIADRPLRRMRGLLGRPSLPVGEGMLLQPAPSIHTAFMRFPIDVVFLDRSLRVLKIVEKLRPWRVASAPRARAALELAVGEGALRGIEAGDYLGVVETDLDTEDAGWTLTTSVALSGRRSRDLAGTAPADQSADAPDQRAISSTRILLVGTDRRFRSVAAALLTRRGCTVIVSDRTVGVAELASRERADVVVLDAGSSLTVASREAARAQTLECPVAVVVVGDDPEEGLSGMPVLAKWGPFQGLYGAIENARLTASQGSPNGRH
jgi:uncharacterized protein